MLRSEFCVREQAAHYCGQQVPLRLYAAFDIRAGFILMCNLRVSCWRVKVQLHHGRHRRLPTLRIKCSVHYGSPLMQINCCSLLLHSYASATTARTATPTTRPHLLPTRHQQRQLARQSHRLHQLLVLMLPLAGLDCLVVRWVG